MIFPKVNFFEWNSIISSYFFHAISNFHPCRSWPIASIYGWDFPIFPGFPGAVEILCDYNGSCLILSVPECLLSILLQNNNYKVDYEDIMNIYSALGSTYTLNIGHRVNRDMYTGNDLMSAFNVFPVIGTCPLSSVSGKGFTTYSVHYFSAFEKLLIIREYIFTAFDIPTCFKQ